MTVITSDIVSWRGRDGTTRTGRVTATSSCGMILVKPDGGCVELGCSRQPGLEQITQANVIAVNRALYNERDPLSQLAEEATSKVDGSGFESRADHHAPVGELE